MIEPNNRRPRRAGIGCEPLEGRQLLAGLTHDVLKFIVDTRAVHPGSRVPTAAGKAAAADAKAVAQVATTPDPAAIATLETEVQAIGRGPITPTEGATLEAGLDAALVSASVPSTLAQQTTSDLGAVLTTPGITSFQVKRELGDLKAILNDLGSSRR